VSDSETAARDLFILFMYLRIYIVCEYVAPGSHVYAR